MDEWDTLSFSLLQKLVENEVREQIKDQVEALHRKIDEALSQESLAAGRIADVLNACFCSNGVDTDGVDTLRDDVATFRQDLMMMKNQQWILDGKIVSLQDDLADVKLSLIHI